VIFGIDISHTVWAICRVVADVSRQPVARYQMGVDWGDWTENWRDGAPVWGGTCIKGDAYRIGEQRQASVDLRARSFRGKHQTVDNDTVVTLLYSTRADTYILFFRRSEAEACV
jgi:hypothetical protein